MNITKMNYERFISEYQKAKKLNKISFMFEGKEVLTTFAKFLIEYLEDLYKD